MSKQKSRTSVSTFTNYLANRVLRATHYSASHGQCQKGPLDFCDINGFQNPKTLFFLKLMK